MGACNCNLEQTKNKDLYYDPARLGYLAKSFKYNQRLLYILIRIQSRIRGIIFRNTLRNPKNYKSKFKLNYDNDNDNEYSTFIEVDRSKCLLNENDIKELFKLYPKIDSNNDVELRLPVEYEDGSIYLGEWKCNTNYRHGRGIQLWEDGTKYTGYFVDNKANIKGILSHSDGDIYEGSWINGKADGFGIYKHVDGSIYRGNWKQDKQHGEGQENWPDGSYYKGEYFLGRKEGKGIFSWGDGSVYEGDFEDNLISGKGSYKWEDGRSYIGLWKKNRMHGRGAFKWNDGRTYEGEYNDDKRHGYGIFNWPDGRMFKGFWNNGKQHGKGEFYNPVNKTWKKGIWNNGKRSSFEDKNKLINNQINLGKNINSNYQNIKILESNNINNEHNEYYVSEN